MGIYVVIIVTIYFFNKLFHDVLSFSIATFNCPSDDTTVNTTTPLSVHSTL